MRNLVGVIGFEPTTPSSRTRCAISYSPFRFVDSRSLLADTFRSRRWMIPAPSHRDTTWSGELAISPLRFGDDGGRSADDQRTILRPVPRSQSPQQAKNASIYSHFPRAQARPSIGAERSSAAFIFSRWGVFLGSSKETLGFNIQVEKPIFKQAGQSRSYGGLADTADASNEYVHVAALAPFAM